jgi:hypothetical protein
LSEPNAHLCYLFFHFAAASHSWTSLNYLSRINTLKVKLGPALFDAEAWYSIFVFILWAGSLTFSAKSVPSRLSSLLLREMNTTNRPLACIDHRREDRKNLVSYGTT